MLLRLYHLAKQEKIIALESIKLNKENPPSIYMGGYVDTDKLGVVRLTQTEEGFIVALTKIYK